MSHAMTFTFRGATGRDIWINALPEKWQARIVAKKLLRSTWKGADPDASPLYIQMPKARYRIVDTRGRVELAPGSDVPQGVA